LTKGALIDAVAADEAWYARFIVRLVEGRGAHLGLVDEVHFKPLPPPEGRVRPRAPISISPSPPPEGDEGGELHDAAGHESAAMPSA
jgi:hypothetical protein